MKITLKNLAKWCVAQVLITSGMVRAARRRTSRGEYIPSIYFHNPTKEEFESSVKWLKKHGYSFLSPDDLERIFSNDLLFPYNAVLLTADDGWESNEANIVATAVEHNVPVTIFVTTGPVEGDGVFWWSYLTGGTPYVRSGHPGIEKLHVVSNKERLDRLECIKATKFPLKRECMTVEQVKNAAASGLVTIGSHTHSHPILLQCTSEEARFEIDESKRKIEDWIGKPVRYFAYPNGVYKIPRDLDLLRDSGIKLAFGIDESPLTPEKLKNPFELPRSAFIEGASLAENICRMTGAWEHAFVWVRSKKGLLRRPWSFVRLSRVESD